MRSAIRLALFRPMAYRRLCSHWSSSHSHNDQAPLRQATTSQVHFVVFSNDMCFVHNHHTVITTVNGFIVDLIITGTFAWAPRILTRSIAKNCGSIILNSLCRVQPDTRVWLPGHTERLTRVVANTTRLQSGCWHLAHTLLHQSFRLSYFPT